MEAPQKKNKFTDTAVAKIESKTGPAERELVKYHADAQEVKKLSLIDQGSDGKTFDQFAGRVNTFEFSAYSTKID